MNPYSSSPYERRGDERPYESGRYPREERELGRRGERYANDPRREDWQCSQGWRDEPFSQSSGSTGYGSGRGPEGGESDYGFRREEAQGGYGSAWDPQRSGYESGYAGSWQRPGSSLGRYTRTSARDQATYGGWGGGLGGTPPYGGARRSGSWGSSPARSQGSFAGRGPKGYQRSDERIREAVSERLEEADDVDASEIEVGISGGEVTLKGSVESRWMKRRAEDCIADLPGVKDVTNQLRVQESSERGDEAGKERERSGNASRSGQQSKATSRS